MTTYATPSSATGRWMTLPQIARESGLREDLVSRFVPHMDTPTGPLYSAHHLGIARYVKQLTDMRLPNEAIDVAVRDAVNRPDAQFGLALATGPTGTETRRGRLWAAAGAAAAVALIIGGAVGGLIGYNNGGGTTQPTAAAPVTVTAEAPPPAQITIPATPDPVCAEWAPMLDSYNAQQAAWTKTDPGIPAERWSPEQRALTTGIIPVLKDEAADMRRLADKAEDPFLASLMTGQAVYEEAYVQRLPNYQPSDHRYWNAVIAFSGAVKAVCSGQ